MPAWWRAKSLPSSAPGKVENFAITMPAGRCTKIDWPFMPSAAYTPRGASSPTTRRGRKRRAGPVGRAAEARKASISSPSRTRRRAIQSAARPARRPAVVEARLAEAREVAERRADATLDDREPRAVEHDLRVVLGADARPHLARKSSANGGAADPFEHPAEHVGRERAVAERAGPVIVGPRPIVRSTSRSRAGSSHAARASDSPRRRGS